MEYVNLTLAAMLEIWNRATSTGIRVRAHIGGDAWSANSRWTTLWLRVGVLVGTLYIRLVDYQANVTG